MGRLQTFLRKHRSEMIGMSIFEYNKEEMKYDSLKVDNNFWNYSKVWKNTWNPVNKLTLSGESVIIIGQQDNQTWSDLLASLRKSGANPELFFAVFNVKRVRHYQSASQHVIKDRDSSNNEALFFVVKSILQKEEQSEEKRSNETYVSACYVSNDDRNDDSFQCICSGYRVFW